MTASRASLINQRSKMYTDMLLRFQPLWGGGLRGLMVLPFVVDSGFWAGQLPYLIPERPERRVLRIVRDQDALQNRASRPAVKARSEAARLFHISPQLLILSFGRQGAGYVKFGVW